VGLAARSRELTRLRARLALWCRATLTRLAEFARLGRLPARLFEAVAEAGLSAFDGRTAVATFHRAVLENAACGGRRPPELARSTAAATTAATAAAPPASTTLTALGALAVLAGWPLHDRCRDLAPRSCGLGCLHWRRRFFARRPLARTLVPAALAMTVAIAVRIPPLAVAVLAIALGVAAGVAIPLPLAFAIALALARTLATCAFRMPA
jgi:hypothetical protein